MTRLHIAQCLSLSPRHTKIKAERRLVENCADRNLIGQNMKEREPAIKIDIPLMEEVTWFRQYLVKQNDQ